MDGLDLVVLGGAVLALVVLGVLLWHLEGEWRRRFPNGLE